MMTLVEAASFFDESVFTDTYGVSTFNGQLLPFSDSTRSGDTTRRRILEVAPSVTIPVRYTVTSSSGQVYLVSLGAEDFFDGDAIRMKYPVVPVSDQFVIRDIGELLAGSGGSTDSYMLPSYIHKNSVEDQSENVSTYNVFHSRYYTVSPGDILYGGGKYYRAREGSRVDDIGFGVVHAVLLESPTATLDYTSNGDLDVITDTYTPTVTSNVPCFVEQIVFDFHHTAVGANSVQPADRAVSFLKSDVASVATRDTIGSYRVLTFDDNGTFWTIHGRPLS